MEPGGFDELDIKLKMVIAALVHAVPGFGHVLEAKATETLHTSDEPLERYALLDILEVLTNNLVTERAARG